MRFRLASNGDLTGFRIEATAAAARGMVFQEARVFPGTCRRESRVAREVKFGSVLVLVMRSPAHNGLGGVQRRHQRRGRGHDRMRLLLEKQKRKLSIPLRRSGCVPRLRGGGLSASHQGTLTGRALLPEAYALGHISLVFGPAWLLPASRRAGRGRYFFRRGPCLTPSPYWPGSSTGSPLGEFFLALLLVVEAGSLPAPGLLLSPKSGPMRLPLEAGAAFWEGSPWTRRLQLAAHVTGWKPRKQKPRPPQGRRQACRGRRSSVRPAGRAATQGRATSR